MKRACLSVALILVISLSLIAEDRRPMTPADIIGLESVGSPVISPDGSKAIYIHRTTDLEKSSRHMSMWMADLESGETWQFTNSSSSDHSPRWKPDGGAIAFIRGGQLWLIPVHFGEAKQLTELPEGVSDFRWSPDGKLIYIQSTQGRTGDVKKRYEEKMSRKDDAVVVDSELWNEQFYVLDPESGKPRLLSEGHPGIDGFEVSPDGSHIVYSTNYTGRMDDDLSFDLWLVDTKTGKQQQLTDFPGPETSPSWSPDSKYVAYISTTEPDVEFAQSDVTVIEAVAGAKPDVLTIDYDRAAMSPDWAADGWIYFLAADKTETPLMRVRPDVAVEAVPYGGYILRDFSISNNVSRVLALGEKYPGLPELLFLNRESGDVRPVTTMSAQLANFILPEQRVITYENEGQELEAILLIPAMYKGGNTKLPLVLEYHGGPYGRRTNTFRSSWQAFAGAGYAVVAPNYRGGVGYGDAFGRALRNDFGGVDYRDSIAAVDAVIEMGLADPDRLAVTGGSWGGYLTNWTVTQTDRFDAAVSLFGIFSFYTDMSNSIQSTFERMYFGGHYWEGNPLYDERAPQTHVTKVDTPVLIMHGMVDTLTFIANSNEFYTALRLLGKEVEYIKYPREGHGFREPVHQVDYLQRSIAWFRKHVK